MDSRGYFVKRCAMMLAGILFISICVGCYRLSGFGVDVHMHESRDQRLYRNELRHMAAHYEHRDPDRRFLYRPQMHRS